MTISPKLPLSHTSEQSGATILLGIREAMRVRLEESNLFLQLEFSTPLCSSSCPSLVGFAKGTIGLPESPPIIGNATDATGRGFHRQRDTGACPRPHRRSWPSRPDLGERWPSRLVATTAENRLSILRARHFKSGSVNRADGRRGKARSARVEGGRWKSESLCARR